MSKLEFKQLVKRYTPQSITINKADLAQLESIARSRTEPAGRVERQRTVIAHANVAAGATPAFHD